MIETRNISGTTAVEIFPYLSNSNSEFNSKYLSNRLQEFSSATIETLSICNTYSANTTVSLYIFDIVESDFEHTDEYRGGDMGGELTTNYYYILKGVVMPTTTTIILNENDLKIFDPIRYGLAIVLGGSSEAVDILYKIKNYNI